MTQPKVIPKVWDLTDEGMDAVVEIRRRGRKKTNYLPPEEGYDDSYLGLRLNLPREHAELGIDTDDVIYAGNPRFFWKARVLTEQQDGQVIVKLVSYYV